MKGIASNIAFVDLYKEKDSDPGTPCGVIFTFLMIILAVLTLAYVIADSYWDPALPNPVIGGKTKTNVQNIDLSKLTAANLPKLTYKCFDSTSGCLIYRKPVSPFVFDPCTEEICNGIFFQSTITFTVKPAFYYVIFTRTIFEPIDRKFNFGHFEFQSGVFTSIPGENITL